MKKVFLSIATVGLLASSCGEKTEDQTTANDQPTVVAEPTPEPEPMPEPTPMPEFVLEEGTITTASGLHYLKVVETKGASPLPTSIVKTHYHGTLSDGTVFDSSVDRGEPIEFGVNQVIQGWQEALVMMKKGEKWILTIPPHLAYGEMGAGPLIGPNATLRFEIELIDFK